jgi:hypothetical protein
MAKPVNLFFPGRKPDWRKATAVLFEMLDAQAELQSELDSRLAALEREAEVNGNGERG